MLPLLTHAGVPPLCRPKAALNVGKLSDLSSAGGLHAGAMPPAAPTRGLQGSDAGGAHHAPVACGAMYALGSWLAPAFRRPACLPRLRCHRPGCQQGGGGGNRPCQRVAGARSPPGRAPRARRNLSRGLQEGRGGARRWRPRAPQLRLIGRYRAASVRRRRRKKADEVPGEGTTSPCAV